VNTEKTIGSKLGRKAGRPKGTSTGSARELTSEEIKRLFKCLSGKHRTRDTALLWICLSGCRVSEAVSLSVDQVSADGKVTQGFVLDRHETKSKRSRRIYMPAPALKAVQALLDEMGETDGTKPLLRSQKGGFINSSYAVMLIDKLFKNAGISGVSSHSLRRSFANNLRRSGADLLIVKEALGHASISTTEIYLSSTPMEQRTAIENMKF